MSITVALHHKTIYRYKDLVQLAPHVIRLRPAPHCRTPILSYSLKVKPAEKFPFKYTEEERIALVPYLTILPSSGRVDKLAAELKRDIALADRKTIDVLVDINRHIRDLLRYEI